MISVSLTPFSLPFLYGLIPKSKQFFLAYNEYVVNKHLWLLILGCLCLTLFSCTRGKPKFVPELHLPYQSEIGHMDPARVVTVPDGDACEMVYEGLLEFHYLKRPYELQPGLAAAMPKVTEGGSVYTISLKPGVKFHPDTCFGQQQTREMTAKDVEYSFKRLLDAKVAAPIYSDLKEIWPGAEAFHKASEAEAPTNYELPVEAITLLNPTTIRFKLKYPFSLFPYYLATTNFFIVPRECVEHYKETFQNHPVGTGPYILKKWLRKSDLIYEANPHYHGRYPTQGEPGDREAGLLEDAGKPLPFISKIIYTMIPEVEPMWLKFLAGDIDVSAIPQERYDSVIVNGDISDDMKQKGIVGRKIQGLITRSMYINLKHLALSNGHVRRALMLSLDIPAVLKQLYGDRYLPAQSHVPPLLWPPGDFAHPYRGPDLLQAKAELEKAGYPEGKGLPAFKVATATGPDYRQLVEALDLYTKKVGIRLVYDGMNAIQWTKVLTEGQFDLLISSGYATYPDPENFLAGAYSKNWPHGGNYGKYMDSTYDRWYEQIRRLPLGSQARDQILAKMIRKLQQDISEIPLWIYNSFTLRYDTLRNYKNNHALWTTVKYWKKEPPAPSTP